ncbi:MAG: ATPase [Candidatus Cloacimonetes bacterium]|nr:ATPase [Candidatus Cloacimonadota bacterium]MCF7815105.1 ATPase [Candidatus Cloacimonadota bacterium]MCF7868050.1 ATPase [Candidatus Cloacimonadota bacterium]MCF7883970.1 ATPase [Candidatus Cloacimonadota bacterium]
MAQKGIREFDAKRMMSKALPEFSNGKIKFEVSQVLIGPKTDLQKLADENPWLKTAKLVAKPDQLFGKRGLNNLLYVNKTWQEVQAWIKERMNKTVTIKQTTGETTGELNQFLVEKFVPHEEEYYIAITTHRENDTIHFSTHGGVNIEEVWDTVVTLDIPIMEDIADQDVEGFLPAELGDKKQTVADFIKALYKMVVEYHFVYLELNPFTFVDGVPVALDAVAKVDDYASYQCAENWGELKFPSPFGLEKTPEEEKIDAIDERTGASLKLTVLNPEGRIWNLVAGGGASVIYADTVVDLGYHKELANYGEYSGNPSTEDTYAYTKTVLDLMTRQKDPQGRPKFLLIGGGIANFTDVAKTFTGIVQAITEFKEKIKETNVKIYVRRGGPNYVEGLNIMKRLGEKLGVPIEVYGPETHMTKIVSLALGQKAGA